MFLRLDARTKLNWEKTHNGLYRAVGIFGKVDLPLSYYSFVNGKLIERTETITEGELFNEDSIKTALGMPIVLQHPSTGTFERNADRHLVGSTMQEFVRTDSGELGISLVVHDSAGIKIIEKAIQDGTQAELSPGYFLKGLQLRNDGVFEQIFRIYDHGALLAPGEGRGGQSLTIRTDSKDPLDFAYSKTLYLDCKTDCGCSTKPEESKESEKPEEPEKSEESKDSELTTTKKSEGKPMTGVDVVIRLDGADRVHRDVPLELAAAIDSLKKRVDSVTADMEGLEEQISAKDAEIAALKSDKSNLEGQLTAAQSQLTDAQNQRNDSADIPAILELWDLVEPALKNAASKVSREFKRDYRLDAADIKKVYLKAVAPHVNLDGKDSSFINGLWEGYKPRKPQDSSNSSNPGGGNRNDSVSKTDGLFDFLDLTVPRTDSSETNNRQSFREERAKEIEKNARS